MGIESDEELDEEAEIVTESGFGSVIGVQCVSCHKQKRAAPEVSPLICVLTYDHLQWWMVFRRPRQRSKTSLSAFCGSSMIVLAPCEKVCTPRVRQI